jgi:predicted PurR-regulated permease PerM
MPVSSSSGTSTSLRVIAVATTGLLLSAIFYALSAAASFFVPVVLAVLLDRLLTPLVRRMRENGIPAPVGAALLLAVLVGSAGTGLTYLAEPASEWMETAPQRLRQAEYRLRGLTEPLEEMQEAADEVSDATTIDGQAAASASSGGPTFVEQFMSQAGEFASGFVVSMLLLYFLLSSGSLFLRRLVYVLPRFAQKRKAVMIARGTESQLSRYLGTLCLINLGVGLAIGGLMYAIGMPNPALWGAMAALLNFVPYLGPLVGVTIVGVVGLVTFESVDAALLPALAYFLVNMVEGNLVTPAVLGWRLTLHPVVVLVSIIFWTWLWGIPGGLLAVPMVTTFKIVCDHVELLQPIGVLLGGERHYST